jgi:hypothetical protein
MQFWIQVPRGPLQALGWVGLVYVFLVILDPERGDRPAGDRESEKAACELPQWGLSGVLERNSRSGGAIQETCTIKFPFGTWTYRPPPAVFNCQPVRSPAVGRIDVEDRCVVVFENREWVIP